MVEYLLYTSELDPAMRGQMITQQLFLGMEDSRFLAVQKKLLLPFLVQTQTFLSLQSLVQNWLPPFFIYWIWIEFELNFYWICIEFVFEFVIQQYEAVNFIIWADEMLINGYNHLMFTILPWSGFL